jgi:hypothetical protein
MRCLVDSYRCEQRDLHVAAPIATSLRSRALPYFFDLQPSRTASTKRSSHGSSAADAGGSGLGIQRGDHGRSTPLARRFHPCLPSPVRHRADRADAFSSSTSPVSYRSSRASMTTISCGRIAADIVYRLAIWQSPV